MTLMHIITEIGEFGPNRLTVTGHAPISLKSTELELSGLFYDVGRVRMLPKTYEVQVPPPAIDVLMDAIMRTGRQLKRVNMTEEGQEILTEIYKAEEMDAFLAEHVPKLLLDQS